MEIERKIGGCKFMEDWAGVNLLEFLSECEAVDEDKIASSISTPRPPLDT
jgi:hypothetical protein